MPNLNFLNNSVPMILDTNDIVVYDDLPSSHEVIEAHDPDHVDFGGDHVHLGEDFHHPSEEIAVTVTDAAPNDFSVDIPSEDDDVPEGVDVVVEKDGEPVLGIDLGDLPGAPSGTKDPDVKEEEEELVVEESDQDSNDAQDKSKKKDDKWDWKSKGFGQFTVWIKDRFDAVPKHSGYDEAGLERAHAYLERLHGEISKAMRADIDGELEADIIASIHEKIEQGLEKLEDRLGKVKDSKSKKRKKKADSDSDIMVKEAQKVFGIQNGVVITVPLFISALARTLVNGMVSAGKDIEDSYKKLVKKYDLTDREKIELIQLLQDMGLPMIKDRSILPEEGFNPESTENFDYSANYKA
jgi:ElaB/YqjD/DUF883 family membrane-anchored ribosome-binding protein